MRMLAFALPLIFGLGLLPAPMHSQQKGGEEETGPYDVAAKWPAPFARSGYVQGSQGGVFAETPNRIFLANRGELKLPEKLPNNFNGAWGSLGQAATGGKPELRNCIIVVDGNGKVVESWTQHDHLFVGGRGPHKIEISPYDPQRHVWVVDGDYLRAIEVVVGLSSNQYTELVSGDLNEHDKLVTGVQPRQ